MSNTLLDAAGISWFAGSTNDDTWPLAGNNLGAADTDPANSKLYGARHVLLYGVQITTAAAVNVEILIGSTTPTVGTGLVFSAAALTSYRFPNPIEIKLSAADDANVGLRIGAVATATLFFKKLA